MPFKLKKDSRLGRRLKKGVELPGVGGFYLKGFKPGALFFRDQLETGIVAGKEMAQGNFGSVKGAEKIARQFVKQLKKRKVPKPESRKN